MDLAARLIPMLRLAPIAVVFVLVNIYPYHPATSVGWGVLLLLSLPIMLAGEFFGERALGAPFVAKFPRDVRIGYGVVILGSSIAALMFALHIWPNGALSHSLVQTGRQRRALSTARLGPPHSTTMQRDRIIQRGNQVLDMLAP